MALDDTRNAIGAVTRALKQRIESFSTIPVDEGRPDHTSLVGFPHLNLFLYEIAFDPYLKKLSLNEGEKTPIWMVLKYMLTAFEASDDSDSVEAHRHLGAALRALYHDDLLKLTGLPVDVVQALDSNPGELHVTFDESPADLLAKVMQGTDEKFRISIAFQVRPVMIASAEPADYSLLVGVDYTNPPALTPEPVGIEVIPSMGSFISEISPTGFEVGEEVIVRGTDLHLSDLSVMLGPVELPVTMQRPDELRFTVDPAIIGASTISAGSHPVTVVLTLPVSGKKRASNAVIGNLVPTLNTADIAPLSLTLEPPVPPPGTESRVFATIDLGGVLLGNDADDVILAFYRDGGVVKMFDVFTPVGVPPPLQPDRQLVMTVADAVGQGDYLMILRVNGQQAPQSPLVQLVGP